VAWNLATDKLSEALSGFLAQQDFSTGCQEIFNAIGVTIEELKANSRRMAMLNGLRDESAAPEFRDPNVGDHAKAKFFEHLPGGR
jgi:hypothetical protein